MRRLLLRSNTFMRTAKRLLRKRPEVAEDIQSTLELLSIDAFHSKLKSHKLKGDLEGSWACSVGYDLRIVFEFVQHDGSEAILLETIGTHDEVY